MIIPEGLFDFIVGRNLFALSGLDFNALREAGPEILCTPFINLNSTFGGRGLCKIYSVAGALNIRARVDVSGFRYESPK